MLVFDVRLCPQIRFMRMIRVLKLQKMVEHLAEIGAFASLLGRLCNIAFWVLVRTARTRRTTLAAAVPLLHAVAFRVPDETDCHGVWDACVFAQLIAHVLGCGWFFLADINSSDRITWAHDFDLHQPDAPLSTKYITSLYWAFVTVRPRLALVLARAPRRVCINLSLGLRCTQVTTVGYGDIVPRTDGERIYVIVCTFIGNLAFAYMIGKMTAMAARVDAAGQMYQVKMDEVVSAPSLVRGTNAYRHL